MINKISLSPLQLQGCVCSNVVGLLGTLLAFGLYYYTLHTSDREVSCSNEYYSRVCLPQLLAVSVISYVLVFALSLILIHCSLFIFSLSNPKSPVDCSTACLSCALQNYSWSVTLLLLLFDTGAVVMHCLLSISAFKTLKTN